MDKEKVAKELAELVERLEPLTEYPEVEVELGGVRRMFRHTAGYASVTDRDEADVRYWIESAREVLARYEDAQYIKKWFGK